MHIAFIFAGVFGVVSAGGSVATVSSGAAASTTDASPAAGTGFFGDAAVCFPKLNNGSYDATAPCRQALAQSVACIAFADDGGNKTASGGGHADSDVEDAHQGGFKKLFNATLNQECVCKPDEPGSTYFENVAG